MKNRKRIVVKVGTSSLAHSNGKVNYRKVEALVRVLSDLNNAGNEIILVSSGAIGVGIGKLSLKEKPTLMRQKQAVAAVGQCELMFIYDKLFGEHNNTVAQILLTKDVIDDPIRKENAQNTFNTLLEMDAIAIVNENDSIATEEIEFGDNDNLSAIVAVLVDADLLVILSDVDGLYDKNPHSNSDAKLIERVNEIDDEIWLMAGGADSNLGTGGMATKISAATLALRFDIDMVIADAGCPDALYDILDGKSVGTIFTKKQLQQ